MAFLFLAQIPLYHRVLQLYAKLRSTAENSLFWTLQTPFPALLRQILRWAKGWTSGSGPPYLNNWRKDTYTRTLAFFCANSPFLKFSVTSAYGHPHRKRRMKNLNFPGTTEVTGCVAFWRAKKCSNQAHFCRVSPPCKRFSAVANRPTLFMADWPWQCRFSGGWFCSQIQDSCRQK